MVVRRLSALLKSLSGTATTVAGDSLASGRIVHAKSITLGLHTDPILCRALVGFYLSFDLAHLAIRLLDSAPSDDVSPWNAFLSACSKRRLNAQALCVLRNLLLLSPQLKPDAFTYPSALKACAGLGAALDGEFLHAGAIKHGFSADVVVSSSLVYMYAKCHRFASAIQMFDEMPQRDAACWNTIMSCYYQSEQPSKALEVFDQMTRCGFQPDSVTYTTAFSACARLADLDRGKRVYEVLIASGFELDDFITSSIVDMYAKCGNLETAREVFEQIQSKSVFSWNSIITGYSSAGDSCMVLDLFTRMIAQGIRPTSTTVSCLVMACSKSSNFGQGRFFHGYIVRNCIVVDIYVASSLVDLYFKCEMTQCAEYIFAEMPKSDVVSWNVMLSGYVMAGSYFKAIELFHGMSFSETVPDDFAFASVLSACSQLGALDQGREIHKQISVTSMESNETVMCALLDMYAKCGAIGEARAVFDKLASKDVLSWTSMIMAYGSHGQAAEALELFHGMQNANVKPDRVTFLALLSACNHGGLVIEGCYYFNRMMNEYGIKPRVEHYSCLIDLLGRSGHVGEALSILKNTPDIRADAGLLGSLLSACSLHKNLKLGEAIASLLVKLDPDDHSASITLANMYASAGRWDDRHQARTRVKERGLKKNPGCSWIESGRAIHQFFVKDDSHTHTNLIYEWLGYLSLHMEDNFEMPMTLQQTLD